MSTSVEWKCLLALILVYSPLWARGQENPRVCGKTMEQWIAVLRDPETSVRERTEAVRTLAYFGPSAREAVPDLVARFQGRNAWPNPDVIDTLGQIGPAAAPAVPLLIRVFAKEECTLGKQGTFGISDYGNVQIALARIGEPAVKAVAKMLFDPNEEIHPCAADILAEIGPDAKSAVPDLIRAIKNPTPRYGLTTQTYAVKALGRIGPAAKAAIPVLNSMVGQENVTEALVAIGAPPVSRLTELVVHDGDTTAAEDLADLGARARDAVPALRKALGDPQLMVRMSAAIALAGIDPPAREAVPVLIDMLENHPDESSTWVADALGRLGPAAREAVPGLIRDFEKTKAVTSLLPLVQIDGDGNVCVPTLCTALDSQDDLVVNTAAECLSLLGPKAKAAVPSLAKTLTRDFGGEWSNYNARVSAARALVRVEPEGRLAIPALISALRREQTFRVPADDDGGQHENKKDEAGPVYDSPAAQSFARALGCYGATAKEAVPYLIEVMRNRVQENERWPVRVEAALALGQVGHDARAAIPALREAVQSRIFEVADAAVIALVRVAPDGSEIARAWVDSARRRNPLNQFEPPRTLKRMARVLGALGESSLEGDWMTAYCMRTIDDRLNSREVRNGDTLFLEDWFLDLGRLGWGARKAIFRLRRAQTHPNPWARLWTGEALAHIQARR